jgi:hypothetical protein
MKYKLYLDDTRTPSTTDWVIVRTYEEFISYIETNGLPYYVSFDHDLAQISYKDGVESFEYYETTGYDCAKWLVDYCIRNNKSLPEFNVHSANPVGSENINKYLFNAKKHLDL